MKPRKSPQGLMMLLGTIQYGVVLAGGGALWLLLAEGTGFFGGDLPVQIIAIGLLLALIAAEAWWAHMPGASNPWGDYLVDFLSSAAIAAFGMAVVVAVGLALQR
jgi:hypothetical protein